ncbi:EbsA family protein [Corynebacterium sp. YIM 101645]|uniref:EbsA family protein n=1 Tax=Corynebacterium lemuris TaxID=1859292 RepID=A0ABT2FUP3_9CORY|nr:EbsA family protein [Corynebacterium lemuris]MCS5478932.1 EbsA family protein [Corynebacterium lemuris]
MEETLAEALATGMIIRIFCRNADGAQIDVGQAWARSTNHIRIRSLEDRRYRDIPLSDITSVEIIEVYLKDYGS